MQVRVKTMNTLYNIIDLNNKLYIQGHDEFCPNYTACDYISIKERMIFKPCGGQMIYTSTVQSIEFEVIKDYVNSEKSPANNECLQAQEDLKHV